MNYYRIIARIYDKNTTVIILLIFLSIVNYSMVAQSSSATSTSIGRQIVDKSETISQESSFTNVIDLLVEKAKTSEKESNIEYYRTGQNGIELIARKNNLTIVVSTYDSRPVLKEAAAQYIYEKFDRGEINKDTVLTFELPDAVVTGLCKVQLSKKITNLGFYFQKIYWKNGLTEIHQGTEFVATASSAPFRKATIYKKAVAKQR